MSAVALSIENLSKSFLLHIQGGTRLDVFAGVSFDVAPGECVALDGPSGAGKSTLLRCLYGNYLAGSGRIWVDDRGECVDVCAAPPETIIRLRLCTIGYVSQFFRCVPRVPAVDVVAEPLTMLGIAKDAARERAAAILRDLAIGEHLWALAPATFSGGEQQRINIARVFVVDYPVLLLDEPTASLDAANRSRVGTLINSAKARGAAVVGIFHDLAFRSAVADRTINITPWRVTA